MRHLVFLASLSIAMLSACGTRSLGPPVWSAPAASAAPSSPAASPAPARAPLASEQARLADLFRGTPVVFALQPDGSLRATVPRKFSFEAGSIKVKPPLAAVLDRLAKGQLPFSTRMRVAAPSDPEASSPSLARERGLSVRDYLAGRGIAASRLQVVGTTQTDQVEIVVSDLR